MKLEGFIIHLWRAAGRRPQVDVVLAGLPMPAHVLDAVDALDLGEEDISRVYRRQIHSPRFPYPLRATEIACFLSHRKAWQSIVDKGLDFGLVIEDDVELGPNFVGVLDMAKGAMGSMDYVRFPRRGRGESGSEVAYRGDVKIIEPRVPGLGAQAQLVARDAAAALLEFTRTFDRPIDTTIQMRWLHGVRILSARPIAIEEIDHMVGGSTIQNKKKPLWEILAREFRRAVYRLSLKVIALSRR